MTEANINTALLAAQKDMPGLQKNAINPHFKNAYISLDSLMEQVLPVLNKHDLILLQLPSVVDGTNGQNEPALRTMLIHAPTGGTIGDTMMLCMAKDDPQGQGSAITYARRYSLMSILGLVADVDDDGEKATAAAAARRPARRVTRTTPTGTELAGLDAYAPGADSVHLAVI